MNDIITLRREVFSRFYSLMCEQIQVSLGSDNPEEDEKTFDYIEATLHALFDLYEKIEDLYGGKTNGKTNGKTKLEKVISNVLLVGHMKGLRFACNKLKHSSKMGRATIIIRKHRYPMMFPTNYSKSFLWGDLSHCYDASRKTDVPVYPCYQKYIQGVEIRCAFKCAIDMLDKELDIL